MPVSESSTLSRRRFMTGLAAATGLSAAPVLTAKADAASSDTAMEKARCVRNLAAGTSSYLLPLYLATQGMTAQEMASAFAGTVKPAAFRTFLGHLREWGGAMEQAIVSGSAALPDPAITGLFHKTKSMVEFFDAISPDLDLTNLKGPDTQAPDSPLGILFRGLLTLERPFQPEPDQPPSDKNYLAFSVPMPPLELQRVRDLAFTSFTLQTQIYDPDDSQKLHQLQMRVSGIDAAKVSLYNDYEACMMQVEQATARLVMSGTRNGKAIAEALDKALTQSAVIAGQAEQLRVGSNASAFVTIQHNIAFRPPGPG